MKFSAYILAVILIGYISHSFLPWWTIVLVAGIIGAFTEYSGIKAFTIGFAGVALLWGLYSFFMNSQNEGILATRVGELFGGMSPLALILITTLIGGLLGGLGSLTGNLGRKIFS